MAKKALSQFKALASPPSILVSYFSSSSQLQRFEHIHKKEKEKEIKEIKKNLSSDEPPVAVWWDLKSCPVPVDFRFPRLWWAICKAIKGSGIDGPIHVSAYANVFHCPKYNWESVGFYNFRTTHVHPGRNRSTHKSLLADLMLWVELHPPPAHLFLISSNIDLASTLHDLRMRKYNILLASNEVQGVLRSDANIIWGWNDLVGNLIGKHSNQPIGKPSNLSIEKHFNQPPDASLYGHYYGPLKDPFLVAEPPGLYSSKMDANSGAEDATLPYQKINTEEKNVQGGEAELPQAIIGSSDLRANQSIKVFVEVVTEVEKYKRLVNLLKLRKELKDSSKIVLYAKTNKECEKLAEDLRRIDLTASAIVEHTAKAKRDCVLSKFKSGECRIITVTALDAHNLDVNHVNHVINYDCPTGLKDFIRRVGRIETKGTAHTFLGDADVNSTFARELFEGIL